MSYPAPKPRMLEGYLADPPVEPNLAWIDLPYADRFAPGTHAGFEELLEALGARVERMPAPKSFAALPHCHKVIYDYEIYRCFADARENHWELLSSTAQAAMQHAETQTSDMYDEAVGIMHAANDWFETFFHDYDAIVTPSATGAPPKFDEGSTGDAICCVIWTLCGLPCLTLPLLSTEEGMPLGVQLVGSAKADDRLLRTARWLLSELRTDDNSTQTQDHT